MPSLIILNGNYSEVQRRDSKCISYKGAWHFNWPFRKETKQFPLPKHLHLSPSKQRPQPSRTSLTRLISMPASASSGVRPRWRARPPLPGVSPKRKVTYGWHRTLVIGHFVGMLDCKKERMALADGGSLEANPDIPLTIGGAWCPFSERSWEDKHRIIH